MIFLTIGSHEPFDRLIAAVDDWAGRNPGRRIFGQITDRARYRPRNFEHTATLTPEQYAETCSKAECLVSHAGMGSIITALDLGKPIVIIPRRAHLGETRNDHQFDTLERFRNKPGIFAAEDEIHLEKALEVALGSGSSNTSSSSFPPFADPDLIAFLRSLASTQ